MKNLQTFKSFINEAASIEKGPDGMYHPQSKDELKVLIDQLISERGNEGDFNDIDTSSITDMRSLFNKNEKFNGDISKWDVSNVTDMSNMFGHAKSFNQPIGNWNVSKVEDMSFMFSGADSFNQDISKWDVHNVRDMGWMFQYAEKFYQNISKWNVGHMASEYSSFVFNGCPIDNSDFMPKAFWADSDTKQENVDEITCEFDGSEDRLASPYVIVNTTDEKLSEVIRNQIIKNKSSYKDTAIEDAFEDTYKDNGYNTFEFVFPEDNYCDKEECENIVRKLLKKYYPTLVI